MTSVLAPIVVLTATSLLVPSQEVSLRRVFTAGAKEAFAVSTNTQMTVDLSSFGQDAMTFSIRSANKLAVEYGTTGEDGKTPISLTYSDMKLEMSGMPGMESLPPGSMPETYTVKAKMDARNILTDVTLEGLTDQQRAAVQGSLAFLQMTFPVFSEQPVKPGDSWDTNLPGNEGLGIGAATLKSTYVGLMDVGGKPMIKITTTAKMPMAMDPTRMAGGGGEGMPPMNVTGQVEIQTEFLLDPATKAVVESSSKGRLQQTMEMVDMGFKIPMMGAITATQKIAK